MKSKRYKKLPEKTKELTPETIDKVLSTIKKKTLLFISKFGGLKQIALSSLMNL